MTLTTVLPGAPSHLAGASLLQFAADASGVGKPLGRFLVFN